MDDLLRTRAKNAEAAARRGKRKKEKKLVSYSLNGKVKRGAMPVWGKILIGIGSLFLALALFVYIPPLFYKDASDNSYVPIMPDASAIKTYQTYLKDNPDADFEQDGLDNTLEAEYGTDVWNVDTDGDGISDYAELFITETSPTDATNIMVKQVMADDEKNGTNLGTPYKMDDIIFWPETYTAKAYGAVVKLSQTDQMISYRFCYYNGWVRFPQEGAYVYGYRDGIHYELKHRETENAWKIENSDEIRLYPSPLTFVYCLKLPFAGTVYIDDNDFGSFLAKVLPEKGGFVNCHKAATIDEDPEVAHDTVATMRLPYMDKSDNTRFGRNMNTLKDLSWLRKVIEADNCVAVSLYSPNAGESIGIIYGYTESGDLLVANESLEPVGKIYITEMAMRMMDKENVKGFRSWFEWKGLGFDSYRYGDRISFFASTLTEAESSEIDASNNDSMVVGEDESKKQDTNTTKPANESGQPQEAAPQNAPAQSEQAQPETPEQQTQAPEPQTPEPQTQAPQTVAETEAKDSVITFGIGG